MGVMGAAVVGAIVAIGTSIGNGIHQSNLADKAERAQKENLDEQLNAQAAQEYRNGARAMQLASVGTVSSLSDIRDAERALEAGPRKRKGGGYNRVGSGQQLPQRATGSPMVG